MSRSGYVEDFDCDDDLAYGRYRGQVASAFRGKRGQDFLRETLDALEGMPTKELADKTLKSKDGGFCTIGAVLHARGEALEAVDLDDDDRCDELSGQLGVAHQMVREIIWANDDTWDGWGGTGYRKWGETPAERWRRMREYIASKIRT